MCVFIASKHFWGVKTLDDRFLGDNRNYFSINLQKKQQHFLIPPQKACLCCLECLWECRQSRTTFAHWVTETMSLIVHQSLVSGSLWTQRLHLLTAHTHIILSGETRWRSERLCVLYSSISSHVQRSSDELQSLEMMLHTCALCPSVYLKVK